MKFLETLDIASDLNVAGYVQNKIHKNYISIIVFTYYSFFSDEVMVAQNYL